ncbi:MAG: hypothetical protein AABY22_00410 [Nanoarchaeota archaeon]
MKKLINKKLSVVVEKYIEKVVRHRNQLKEQAAENRARLFLEDLSVALKTKGIKEWNGDNYTLKLV